MRVVLLLISFISSYYNFLAEGNKEPNGMLLNNPEKSIKGILIDTPSKVPGCGIFCNVVACRFKESITKRLLYFLFHVRKCMERIFLIGIGYMKLTCFPMEINIKIA
jgi:hypothetical protein